MSKSDEQMARRYLMDSRDCCRALAVPAKRMTMALSGFVPGMSLAAAFNPADTTTITPTSQHHRDHHHYHHHHHHYHHHYHHHHPLPSPPPSPLPTTVTTKAHQFGMHVTSSPELRMPSLPLPAPYTNTLDHTPVPTSTHTLPHNCPIPPPPGSILGRVSWNDQ